MPSNTPLPAAEFRRLEGNLIEYAVAVLDDPGNMLAHATLEIALDELKDALAASPRTLEEVLCVKQASCAEVCDDPACGEIAWGRYVTARRDVEARGRALAEAQKGGA